MLDSFPILRNVLTNNLIFEYNLSTAWSLRFIEPFKQTDIICLIKNFILKLLKYSLSSKLIDIHTFIFNRCLLLLCIAESVLGLNSLKRAHYKWSVLNFRIFFFIVKIRLLEISQTGRNASKLLSFVSFLECFFHFSDILFHLIDNKSCIRVFVLKW